MYILFDAQKLAFLIMNLGNNLSFSRAHLIQHKKYRYTPKITIEKMSGTPRCPAWRKGGCLDHAAAFSQPSYSSRRTIKSFITHAE